MPDTKISALSDAGALTGTEIVPLANGAANERTTTQAIANLGGGGAITLISTQVASASASLDFTGLTGTHWKMVGKLLRPATSAAQSLVRIGVGGTPTYAVTGYYLGGTRNGVTVSSTATISSLNQNGWYAGQAQINNQQGQSFVLDIITDNAEWVHLDGFVVDCASDGQTRVTTVGGIVAIAEQLTALRYLEDSGNITQGLLSLYAVDD